MRRKTDFRRLSVFLMLIPAFVWASTQAYWRERDPGFMRAMVEGFRSVRESIPSPVPAGESKVGFLDRHFEAVSVTDGYTWYQSDMVVDLAAETPLPSFQRALSQPLFPQ
jgi:hypothetical protein